MSRLLTRRGCYSLYPDHLSEQDQRTYRRWVRGLFVFYSIVIGAVVAAGFAYRSGGDLTASSEGAKHLTAANSPSGFAASVAVGKR
jgi:hypothetical protein